MSSYWHAVVDKRAYLMSKLRFVIHCFVLACSSGQTSVLNVKTEVCDSLLMWCLRIYWHAVVDKRAFLMSKLRFVIHCWCDVFVLACSSGQTSVLNVKTEVCDSLLMWCLRIYWHAVQWAWHFNIYAKTGSTCNFGCERLRSHLSKHIKLHLVVDTVHIRHWLSSVKEVTLYRK